MCDVCECVIRRVICVKWNIYVLFFFFGGGIFFFSWPLINPGWGEGRGGEGEGEGFVFSFLFF